VDPAKFPESPDVEKYEEPIVLATLIVPEEFLGKVMQLCLDRRGLQRSITYVDSDRILIKFELPLAEIVMDFYDKLKQLTSGYGSFDYEHAGFRAADLCKLDVKLNGKMVEEFSMIIPEAEARQRARELAVKLREEIPRQIVDVAIQACVGGKVLARENVKAKRKTITGKLHASDTSRKRKLQERQNEGKRRMKLFHDVEVPKEAFLNVLRR